MTQGLYLTWPLLTKERNSKQFHFEKGSENWESPTEKFDEPSFLTEK
jgi:hypothetical protein